MAVRIHPLACAARTPLPPCRWAERDTLAHTRSFLPLIFGESTAISDDLLDARGRRLLRRLEEAGWAVVARTEMRDDEGEAHVTFSYHLRSRPPQQDRPVIQAAIDELAAVYDQLPDVAWKHPGL